MFKTRAPAGKTKKRVIEEEADVEIPAVKIFKRDTLKKKADEPSSTPKVLTKYQADEAAFRETDSKVNTAFKLLEVDADVSADHHAIRERNEEIKEKLKTNELSGKLYRGQGAYRDYMEKDESARMRAKATGTMGPQRGNQYIRGTCRFDYWGTSGDGGVCADWKKTGYCGYGDSCKYLHDRSDYKSGWQIDLEFEAEQRQNEKEAREKLAAIERGDPTPEEAAEIEANSCSKCQELLQNCQSPAVITLCGHQFCEACAFAHHKTSTKCFVCFQPTRGIFNGFTPAGTT